MRMTLKRVLNFTALLLLMPCVNVSAQQAADATNQPTNAALERLQGTWQGVMVGHESTGKITITSSGNSFRFHRDKDFWFETTISQPPGTDRKQLHATIKGCPPSQSDSIGEVVFAIFKIEDGTLTLATSGHGAEKIPKSFEATENEVLTLYELRKVKPQKKNTEPSKTE
jgi:uncharacterized protein (TIGR03067 family)